MTTQSIRFFSLLLPLLCLCAPGAHCQDQALKSEAEALFREGVEIWNSGDLDAIIQLAADDTTGFGFRTRTPRGTEGVSLQSFAQIIRWQYESMEYYHITLDELHTVIHDNIVVAWGFHTEDFKVRGRFPEKVRVRFSATWQKTQGEWKRLLSHRDIQRFDAYGQYIPRESGG